MTSAQKPKNLSGTTRTLNKLVEDKQISVDYYSPTKPKVYRLPDVFSLKELQFKHEFLCSQLYVALELTGNLDWWKVPNDYDEFGLKPDRQMIYGGKIFFWEVDRGTEDYYTEKGIKGKLDRYVALSKSRPDRRFHVCFTTSTQLDKFGKVKRTAERRAATILEIIESYERANQLMVTTHDWAIAHTEYKPFMTYSNPLGVSLLDA